MIWNYNQSDIMVKKESIRSEINGVIKKVFGEEAVKDPLFKFSVKTEDFGSLGFESKQAVSWKNEQGIYNKGFCEKKDYDGFWDDIKLITKKYKAIDARSLHIDPKKAYDSGHLKC